MLVTIAAPPPGRPEGGRAVFFVVEPNRHQLQQIIERVRAGRLRVAVGTVVPLAEAASAFTTGSRVPGKTIIGIDL
ncbi:zinc-binding dehydrogenase [Leucobacter sp. gxy201]|uniref:zinc-binding dehydrogenase n=1 Tax=Leucobacter sp. gxy201 TaxID=2957200 RepID=UPI003D9FEC0A